MQDLKTTAEQQARIDCAAVTRLVALYGWDDMIFTHVSMRVPGFPDQILINPHGLMFEEVTASSLVKVDASGAIIQETPYTINQGAFVIHSAIHGARDDVQCVIHLHTAAGVGVSAQRHGLLPLTQNALLTLPWLAYHDYEGATVDVDERTRLASDLGNKKLMILRNHGTLSAGLHAADAFLSMYLLERACEQQVAALTAGPEQILEAPERARSQTARLNAGKGVVAQQAWPALLRKLARTLPGYDA